MQEDRQSGQKRDRDCGYCPGVQDRVLQREVRKVNYGKRVDGLVGEGIMELTSSNSEG